MVKNNRLVQQVSSGRLALVLAGTLAALGCQRGPTAIQAAAAPEAQVAITVAFTEGPTVDDAGDVYFTDVANNRILRYSPGGNRLTTFREDSNRANGLVFDPQGRLIACEGSDATRNSPRVTRTDMKTGKVEVLAAGYQGKKFYAPNDVTFDGKGRLYFTDPVPDATSPTAMSTTGRTGAAGVYRIDTDGKVTRILTAPQVEWPNGVAISPDDKTLYVVDANKVEKGTRAIRAFDLAPDGSASRGRIHYNFYPGRSADGISIDQKGNLYAAAGLNRLRGTQETLATKAGIHVISPAGKLLSFSAIPEDTLTNCAFGGKDWKTLYVTAGKTLFKLQFDTPGTRR